jgi:hypothetical protein
MSDIELRIQHVPELAAAKQEEPKPGENRKHLEIGEDRKRNFSIPDFQKDKDDRAEAESVRDDRPLHGRNKKEGRYRHGETPERNVILFEFLHG